MTRLLLLCVLAPVASAAVWTSTGLDLLEPDRRPEIENIRIDPDGTLRLSAGLETRVEFEENAVWSIAVGPAGRWYAGTGSAGRLYAGNRTAALAAEVGEGELLTVLHDSRAGLLFGLTPGGDVYRLRPDGTTETLLASGEDGVFDLLAGPRGDVYVATGGNGRLYRIPPGAAAEKVFAAPQAHITSLAWLQPGRTLLAGTSPDGLIYRLDLETGRPEVSVLYDTRTDEVRALTVTQDHRGTRVHALANPAGDDNSAPGSVICVGENGTRIWQWSPPAGALYDLVPDRDGILVATGNDGIIYRLDDLGRAAVFQKLPAARVLCLTPAPAGLLAGTSEPAGVFLIQPGLAASGLAVSPVHDCEGPATFGRITWRAQVPSGSHLVMQTRTGNSATPDQTWGEWRQADGTVESRPARFIQWRARLGSEFPGRTPALERVDIHYVIPNRPPVIGGVSLEELPRHEAARGNARPVRRLSWEAHDPDDDSLSFTLSCRPDNHTDWLTIATDLAEPAYELDTRQLPDGWYRFRVEATDAPVRPVGEALRAEAVSTPFLVDNTPPRVTDLRLDGNRLRFRVSDALSPVSAARVSVNAGPWQPVAPLDGLFDSLSENFDLELTLEPGADARRRPSPAHHVAVWAADASGNTVTVALTAVR